MTEDERQFTIDVYSGKVAQGLFEMHCLSARITSGYGDSAAEIALHRELVAHYERQPLAGVPFNVEKVEAMLLDGGSHSRQKSILRGGVVTMRALVLPAAEQWLRKWDRHDIADELSDLLDAARVLAYLESA